NIPFLHKAWPVGCPLSEAQSIKNVSLRLPRSSLRCRTRRPVSRPDPAFSRRRADRGRVPAAATAKRAVHPEVRADAEGLDSVRRALVDPAAQARAHRAEV